MNTVKKGDEFEDKVFAYFSKLINEGGFWASAANCKIYQKRGYYSSARGSDIIFDIAIEIFLTNATDYSSLVLIECKNYEAPVSVEQVESFFDKTQQVSPGNIKAVMISSNGFQTGTFEYSKSKKIALCRLYDKDTLEWKLNRSPSSLIISSFALKESSDAYNALHKKDFNPTYLDFHGFVNDLYVSSSHLFFEALIKQGQTQAQIKEMNKIEAVAKSLDSNVKFLSKDDIDEICNRIFTQIGYTGGAVSLEQICDILRKEEDLVIDNNAQLENGALGEISFEPLEIKISSAISDVLRKRFTLAHELGHLLLDHSKYMAGERCTEQAISLDSVPELGVKDIERMERQANQFASSLLLPSRQFIASFQELATDYGLYDRGFGVLFLDNQKCNLDVYHAITNRLKAEYQVSRTAIKFRLMGLGFLNEKTTA